MISNRWNELTPDDKSKLLEVYGFLTEEMRRYRMVQQVVPTKVCFAE